MMCYLLGLKEIGELILKLSLFKFLKGFALAPDPFRLVSIVPKFFCFAMQIIRS